MISIFTTKQNLESICLDKEKQPWLNMLIKLKEVHVNDDVFSEVDDPDDDIFYTLDQMQINIQTKEKAYINNIPNNPVSVLDNPCGIFLLDIPADKARCIQDEYGVICQSISFLDHHLLTQQHQPTELLEKEPGKPWSVMLSHYRNTPSNSVLVIDAHLFENDRYDAKNGYYDKAKNSGLENLYEILDSILPQRFKDTYHVGVLVTDYDIAKSCRRSRTNLTNKQIAQAINKLRKKLKRGYSISFETLFFDFRDNDGHRLIHNRRILSNYFIVTADYQLAALTNKKCSCSQSITAFSLFENIDNENVTDKKERRVRYELFQLQKYVMRQNNNPTAVLYRNEHNEIIIPGLKHRLLV